MDPHPILVFVHVLGAIVTVASGVAMGAIARGHRAWTTPRPAGAGRSTA